MVCDFVMVEAALTPVACTTAQISQTHAKAEVPRFSRHRLPRSRHRQSLEGGRAGGWGSGRRVGSKVNCISSSPGRKNFKGPFRAGVGWCTPVWFFYWQRSLLLKCCLLARSLLVCCCLLLRLRLLRNSFAPTIISCSEDCFESWLETNFRWNLFS